jgi:hypothetical protein
MFWFYYIQWVLTLVQKKLARGILSIPDPPPNAYKLLKERLLHLYDKGEKDRCRRLLSMPPLGRRWPSELLAEMLQLCLRDDVDGKIIRYMFLFRLTPTMQSMLGEDDKSSISDLAPRADFLMDAEAAMDHAVAAPWRKQQWLPPGWPPLHPHARGSQTGTRARNRWSRRTKATATDQIPAHDRT